MFQLTIQASDSASLQKSTQATVNVQIIRNENPPVFVASSYTATIDTLWAIGRPILTISANDQDKNDVFNQDVRLDNNHNRY